MWVTAVDADGINRMDAISKMPPKKLFFISFSHLSFGLEVIN